MTPAARIQAVIDILGTLEHTDQPADRHLRDWGRMHRFAGSKDRAAVGERVFAILRHRASLAWRMGGDAPRALAIASLLKEGAGADAIAALFGGEGYGPAALDDAERAAIALPPDGEPPSHARGEYPRFLEVELGRAFGNRLLDEMSAMQARAPVDLRVNTLKADRDEVLAALRAGGLEAGPSRYSAFGIRLDSGQGAALARGKLYQSGAFEFQDEAAQIASLLCCARPGMRVLDLAAGAGGKSLALAALMRNEGEIVATDIRFDALVELERRAVRAGVTTIRDLPLPREAGERAGVRGWQTQSIIVPPPHPDPLPLEGGGENNGFDVVLIDAPCSGSGTWRRQPELRWRLMQERLAELMSTQDALLAQAATRVKPGGRLVYATCSILPCENQDRIAAFLDSHKVFSLVPAADIWRESMGTGTPPGMGQFFRATPLSTGTDGFFTAILARDA